MNKKGHWIFGAILSIILIVLATSFGSNWYNFTFSSILIMIGIIAFYSILPDIDHKAGTMTWVFLGIGIGGVVLSLIGFVFNLGFGLSILVASCFLLVATFVAAHWLPHRGPIHTVWVGLISTVPIYILFSSFSYALLAYVAWHSHLIADGYVFKIK